jgi:hypothetical protein
MSTPSPNIGQSMATTCFYPVNPMSKFPGYKVFPGGKSQEVSTHDTMTAVMPHLQAVPKLLEELANCLFTRIGRGQYPPRYRTRHKLVEYGLAVFMGEKEDAIIQEPLALVSIVDHFSKNKETLYNNIVSRILDNDDPTAKGEAFESLVVLSITRLFRWGARLGDVFDFHGNAPEWSHQKARIIVRKENGSFGAFDFVGGMPELPSAGAAFRAEHTDDVQKWIELMHTGWCIPGKNMGPDALTCMELEDGRRLYVAFQMKCYLDPARKSLPSKTTVDAIRKLTPSNWFTKSVCHHTCTYVLRSPIFQPRKEDLAATPKMLNAINNPVDRFTDGDYNVLRVIAAYPQNALLTKPGKLVRAALDADKHPIATLKHDKLNTSLSVDTGYLHALEFLDESLTLAKADAKRRASQP